MKDLIRMLALKADISEEASATAVRTVTEYIKARTPSSLADYIDAAVGLRSSEAPKGLGEALGRLSR